VWGGILAAVLAFMTAPATKGVFTALTVGHPYLMAFAKFCILATMGELLGRCIMDGRWSRPAGLIWRMSIWGGIGIMVMVLFEVFAQGVASVLARGLLPGHGSRLAAAFYASVVANVSFGPVLMVFHRLTDTYIDLSCGIQGRDRRSPSLDEVIRNVDWHNLVSFVLLKTIPFFWVPAHTLTFYLPGEYRVVSAAVLSIVVGAILTLARKYGRKPENQRISTGA